MPEKTKVGYDTIYISFLIILSLPVRLRAKNRQGLYPKLMTAIGAILALIPLLLVVLPALMRRIYR